MISHWKRFAKSILPHSVVRTLTFLNTLRFANGRPNAVLVSIVLTRNVLVSLLNLRSFLASNRAIKVYRKHLQGLAGHVAQDEAKLLHLIYGLKQNEPMHYFHWALIAKMINTIKPDRVLFHYTYEPYGDYWEKLKRHVHLVKVPPFEYYGVARLRHYAHKADVVRLLALYEMGGLYLDIDTLALSSFDCLFSTRQLILGVERRAASTEPRGLCNAVILAPRNHGGIRAWLQSYIYFRGKAGKHWEEHSVSLPFGLLRQRDDVKVLDSHFFFEINWDETQLFFDLGQAARVKARVSGAYSQHLWETSCMTTLLADFKQATPDNKSFLGVHLNCGEHKPSSSALFSSL